MTGVRVIYVGDPAQLPPVGEKFSPVWNITKNEECKAFLKKVMRNDNQLLALATEIRSCMMNRNFVSPIRHNIDENGLGVHLHSSQERFEQHLTSRAKELDWREVKVVAWRNSQVAYYNSIIRYELGYSKPFCKNEVILLARPIERSGQIIAHTDDEFTVVNVSDGSVRVDFNHVNTWHLEAVAGKQTLFLNIPKNQADLDRILSQKASNAKSKKSPTERRRAWTDFWNTKNKFEEVRYGYALTAHRSQGSTLQECYIDQQDILSNFKGIEAYQCLYVACTRPTKVLHTF
jgi:exodeoxyribonuclease-5